MYRILVVNTGVIDCEVMEDILRKKLDGPIEFIPAFSSDEAIDHLKKVEINLLIVDVPHSKIYINNIVWSAYSYHKNIHVILTSVQSEEKIVSLAHKLDVTGYLLKPYRAEELVELIQSLEVASQREKRITRKEERKVYIDRININIQEYNYKKSIETAKEYIDFLYDLGDNISLVKPKIVDFVAEIVNLSESYSKDIQKNLQRQLDNFCSRYDLQNNRFDVLLVVEEMIGAIFQEMERYKIYHGDDIQKARNYIDRNIKNNITLDDVASHVNMSSSYFSKFFKKQTGINFIAYVTKEKIKFAKEMLVSTTMPIINIAFELSYNETNYFSKTFKRNVGVTPTEYRDSYTPES